MKKSYYIEPEILEAAERNTREASEKTRQAIENGTPEERRAAIAEMIQRSQAQRALMCARYGL